MQQSGCWTATVWQVFKTRGGDLLSRHCEPKASQQRHEGLLKFESKTLDSILESLFFLYTVLSSSVPPHVVLSTETLHCPRAIFFPSASSSSVARDIRGLTEHQPGKPGEDTALTVWARSPVSLVRGQAGKRGTTWLRWLSVGKQLKGMA